MAYLDRHADKVPAAAPGELLDPKAALVLHTQVMRRNEKPHYGAIVSAAAFAVPIFWVAQYKAEHDYEFECQDLTD